MGGAVPVFRFSLSNCKNFATSCDNIFCIYVYLWAKNEWSAAFLFEHNPPYRPCNVLHWFDPILPSPPWKQKPVLMSPWSSFLAHAPLTCFLEKPPLSQSPQTWTHESFCCLWILCFVSCAGIVPETKEVVIHKYKTPMVSPAVPDFHPFVLLRLFVSLFRATDAEVYML